MTKWWEGEFLVFDTETTGKDYETARIVTACVARVQSQGRDSDVWNYLINPGIPIEPEAQAVHGISNEMAQDGAAPKDALAGIVSTIRLGLDEGLPIVAFNARFDFTVLDRDCRRNEVATLSDALSGSILPVLDPYVMDKTADKYRKGKRKLGDTCAHYGVNLTDWHSASADAIAAGHLARAMVQTYRGLQLPLLELHRAQTLWAKQQAASLERYLRASKGDETIVCERDWPLVLHESVVSV